MSEKSANPAPLGLLGFGMTTVLLNFIHNFRTGSVDGVIFGMGMFYGGIAQIIAGILSYKKGDTFGTVAFTSYGSFWLSFLVLIWLGDPNVAASNVWPFFSAYGVTPWGVTNEAFAAYFFMWGLFTAFMFFGTLKKNRALQFVFMSLAVLFFLLTAKYALLAYYPNVYVTWFTRITGIEGVICGLSAVYLALAEVLNEAHGRIVLPIGPTS